MTYTKLVTFDYSSPRYTILSGSLYSEDGHPAPCLDGGISKDITEATIRLDLPVPSTVIRASVDWWKLQPDWQNLGIYISLYDQNGNLLAGYLTYYYTPVSTWTTFDTGNISVSNVKYAMFNVGASEGAVNLESRMDNCLIEYIPSQPITTPNDGAACQASYAGIDGEEA